MVAVNSALRITGVVRTCSRTLLPLFDKPLSFMSRSQIINGVSCPFPKSLPLVDVCSEGEHRYASPPKTTRHSRNFSRTRSRLSPRRSIRPPANALQANLVRPTSAVEEGANSNEPVVTNGRNDGRTLRVADVKRLFDDRRHDFNAVMRDSWSLICFK